jgi:hypothetical protein
MRSEKVTAPQSKKDQKLKNINHGTLAKLVQKDTKTSFYVGCCY